MSTQILSTSIAIDAQNPWPGLSAFDEAAKRFFNGRDAESADLLRLVGQEPLTVLFGKSGLGKTSLLQAGLFPLLRQQNILPIYVRLDVRDQSASLIEQAAAALQAEISKHGVDAPAANPRESLWEYLHGRDVEWWSRRNQPLTPLFVFDQFEEVFTLGAENTDGIERLRLDLADLIENRIPAVLAQRIATGAAAEHLDLRGQHYKVLLSLREDFLPEVEGWKRELPSLMRNRLRLQPMSADRAMQVVSGKTPTGTTHELVNDETAREIVYFVAAVQVGDTKSPNKVDDLTWEQLEIEPALLSLVCEGLNQKRKARAQATIDATLLKESGKSIIGDFYERCVADVPDKTQRFIEGALITEGGFRNSYPLQDALDQNLLTQPLLRQLVDRRLLRIDHQLGADRVELIHDRLTDVVRERRDRERMRIRTAQQQKKQRRMGAVVALLLAMGVLFFNLWQNAERANQQADAVRRLVRLISDSGAKPQRGLLLSAHVASLNKEARAFATDILRQQLRVTGGRPLAGHEQSTRVAAFSSDWRWLATGSDDGTIQLWDLNTTEPTSRSLLDGDRGAVHGLVFSPDSQWLVSGGADGEIRLWRLTAQGATPVSVPNGSRYGAIHAVAISPQGDWLVFGTQDGNVCMWKMSPEGPVETPCDAWKDEDPVMNVMFSAKGRWLATTCTGACKKNGAPVRLWDVSADFPNQEPKRLSHATDLGAEDSLLAIAFNVDETRLAVSYGYIAEVWDLTQEDPSQHAYATPASSDGWILTVGLSPDNRWLATGSFSGSDVKLWDLTLPGREPIALKGHSAAVRSVIFSDDGRWLASGADDATARLWDLSDPAMPSTLLRGQDLPVRKVIFSPGPAPRHLVTLGDDPHPRLWNIPDPLADPIVLRGKVKPLIIAMAVSPDDKWIATSSHEDPRLVLWSSEDLRQPAHILPLPSASHSIAFSADRRWLAAKSQDKGGVSLWNLADLSKPPLELIEHEPGDVRSLGFSPDNRWLVSGTWKGGIVNMWDVSVGSPSLEPRHRCSQGDPVRELAFNFDGRYLATAAHGTAARLWDLTSPNPCDSPHMLGPHDGPVYQVVFSRDSRWAATASYGAPPDAPRGKGKLWDIRAGSEPKLVSDLEFKDRVLQAAFSPDNRWVAFGSWDWTVKLLDLENLGASKPTELSGHAGRVSAVSFSPDSRWLATGSEDRTVRLWDPGDPSAAPIILRGHEATVAHIGFSQDSRWIITGAYDGTVRRWRLILDDLVDVACRTAGRHLTPEEVQNFLGDKHTQEACTDQSTAPR